jgi:hypothetical protein
VDETMRLREKLLPWKCEQRNNRCVKLIKSLITVVLDDVKALLHVIKVKLRFEFGVAD